MYTRGNNFSGSSKRVVGIVLRVMIVLTNTVSLALYDSSMLLLSCTYAITANDACHFLLVRPLAHYCFFGVSTLTQPVVLQHKYGVAVLDR